MLYELLAWMNEQYAPPGFDAFDFITTRTAFAAATALIISLIIGRQIIRWLIKMQLKEVIREDIAHTSE